MHRQDITTQQTLIGQLDSPRMTRETSDQILNILGLTQEPYELKVI